VDGGWSPLLGTSTSGGVLDSTALPQDRPLLILGLNWMPRMVWKGMGIHRRILTSNPNRVSRLSQFDSMTFIQSQDDRKRLPVAVHELL
jgi:hypothetical protein